MEGGAGGPEMDKFSNPIAPTGPGFPILGLGGGGYPWLDGTGGYPVDVGGYPVEEGGGYPEDEVGG